MDTINHTTYGCTVCAYTQTIDPNDSEAMALNFPDVTLGDCPSCFAKGIQSPMHELPESSITTNFATDADIESMEVPDFDENGDPVMVASGAKKYQFNENTGVSEQIDVMVQQMRPLTADEITARKSQRDESLATVTEATTTPIA